MLKELPPKKQVEGEPIRRWFFSHQQDLIVWLDDNSSIRGFQLCYDKYESEHAITWRRDIGFTHSTVDDGESSGGRGTPFLYPNGACNIPPILAVFLEISIEVPPDIAAFVAERLR